MRGVDGWGGDDGRGEGAGQGAFVFFVCVCVPALIVVRVSYFLSMSTFANSFTFPSQAKTPSRQEENVLRMHPASGLVGPAAHTIPGHPGFDDSKGMQEYRVHGGPMEHAWSPYELNGGTVLAIAGPDYAVIAADTRLCRGYSILSRNVSRLKKMTEQCVIGTGGCHTDINTLHEMLAIRCGMYKHNHGEEIGTRSFSQLVGNTLYMRRFFPYYAFNVVAGLDENGVGAVYGYDAVGSFQRQPDGIMANGSGSKLIMPVLDNLVAGQHRKECQGENGKRQYTAEEAVALVKEGFITAGERDIMCGDAVEIIVITKEGQTFETFPLKAD